MIIASHLVRRPPTGGGEDGLAEAFEDGRDLFQPLLAGVDFCQEFFQLGDDAALFFEGGRGNLSFEKLRCVQLCGPVSSVAAYPISHKSEN